MSNSEYAREKSIEAKQAHMLHPDYFHGKNVKDKATNE